MTGFARRLAGAARGAAAIEFALAIPVLIGAIIGAAQLGTLFLANAGLNNALDEGARYATIYDTTTKQRPTNDQITTYIDNHLYGLVANQLTGPTYATGTADGAKYLDITVGYPVTLNFIFYRTTTVTLSKTRRVYVF